MSGPTMGEAPGTRRQLALDIALCVFVVAIDQANFFATDASWSIKDALFNLLLTTPLLLRRRYPLSVLITIVTASLASAALQIGFIGLAWLPIGVAAFSVAVHGTHRRWVGLVVPPIVVAIRDLVILKDENLSVAVVLVAIPIASWFAGDQARARERYLARMKEQTTSLEADQESRRLEAIAAERTRIARDLQDVISQSVSQISSHALTARESFDSNGRAAERNLESIESESREALVEMRRLLGLLRAEDSSDLSVAPQPSLSHLENLVDEFRASGRRIDIEILGKPVKMSAGLDLSAYRLVEAALARADATSTPASVRIQYSARDVGIEVRTPRATTDQGTDEMAAVFIQMRERVSLFGGDFEIAEKPESVIIRARLPIQA